MKIKFNQLFYCLFINNNMALNVDEERTKLIKVVNDNKFNYFEFIEHNNINHINPQINFLWYVLVLTIEYPPVESYLKNILNYFTIDELGKTGYNWSILHWMAYQPHKISLNSFVIIINYGVNVNIINSYHSTPAHLLLRQLRNNHSNNILNLFIKYGINLNAINSRRNSILDTLTYYWSKLYEESKNCIITIIDFGGITNNPKKNKMYDFIEYYKCSTIKPAIKNENKI